MSSRKEGNFRHFMLSFSKNDRDTLILINAFMDEFFVRNQPLSISILFFAYDDKFKSFNISTSKFLSKLFSLDKLDKNLNFMRDGMHLEI